MDKDTLYNFFDGAATESEVEQIRKWFESSQENQKELFRERKIFDATLLLSKREKGRPSQYKEHRIHHLQQKRTIKLRIPQAAAIMAIVFTLGMFAYPYIKQEKKQKTAWYEIAAPLGSKSQITLTDGSKVWLNAGSRLLYSTEFGQSNREVQLEGEGYFEVAKNTLLPFEVRTSKLRIRAIGTAFNVKAYQGESVIETILVDGNVEVSRTGKTDNTRQEVFTLQPKQRLTLVKNTNEILFESKPRDIAQTTAPMPKPQEKNDTPNFTEVSANTDFMINTSWKDKRWRIESEELGNFAIKLERRYNVKIQFIDADLPKYKFNGTFEEEPLEEVLKALALAAPVKFSIKGNNVKLSRNDKFKEAHQSLYEQPM